MSHEIIYSCDLCKRRDVKTIKIIVSFLPSNYTLTDSTKVNISDWCNECISQVRYFIVSLSK